MSKAPSAISAGARWAADTAAASWVRSLLERKAARPVTVAMVNKTARIVWAVLARGETYHLSAAI